MRHIAAEDSSRDRQRGHDHRRTGSAVSSSARATDDVWRDLSERILRPLFDYLGERALGPESSVLYVLERYVRRVEWFDREELYACAMQDTRKTEQVYDAATCGASCSARASNVPFSQARSASGLSDVLADLDTEDPLVCEMKIFDAESRGKRNLASGASQVLSSTPPTTASRSATWSSPTSPDGR